MTTFQSKLNTVLCTFSLCIIILGCILAYNNAYLAPKADEISTLSAQGSFGNINLMTEEEFSQLPGIGQTIAKRIVEYRNENGNFEKIEDIMKVKGIGEGKFNKIKDYIYTSR